MILTKKGITIEVFHPQDIRRYKGLGFTCPQPPTEPEAETSMPPVEETREVEKPIRVKASRSKEGKNG